MSILVRSIAIALLLLAGCRGPDVAPPSATTEDSVDAQHDTVSPQPLPLGAPLNRSDVELSGLTWYRDTLVALPQYPSRMSPTGNARVYGIPRSVLLQAVTDSASTPLVPIDIPFEAREVRTHLPEYQGLEAITFVNDRVYVVAEGHAETSGMKGLLLQGNITPGDLGIQVRGMSVRDLPQQATIPNISYEALTARQDTVIALFEANGARVNARPRAVRYHDETARLSSVPFPTLEYRLTDATNLDERDRFWVINYFFPGDYDLLQPAPDTGVGSGDPTDPIDRDAVVERLVEYRYSPAGIRRTNTPPIQFTLRDSPRNWEGLARLGDGFLVATDKFPSTILAYVPGPSGASE